MCFTPLAWPIALHLLRPKNHRLDLSTLRQAGALKHFNRSIAATKYFDCIRQPPKELNLP